MVNDSEDDGKVEIILPDGGNKIDQGSVMSLDDPHLWGLIKISIHAKEAVSVLSETASSYFKIIIFPFN